MGNLIGCFGGFNSSTSCDTLPHILTSSSSGVSGIKNTETKTGYSESSSSGNSGLSFGDQPSSEDLYPPIKPTPNHGEVLDKPNLKVFTFTDLKIATRNFKQETLIGEGGFGRVYKGWIQHYNYYYNNDNIVNNVNVNYNFNKSGSKFAVAIKKLNPESMQGFEEWQSEINFLGRLSHPNLVKLLGYCWEDKELLLVYEYLPKGSLENHLFRRNPATEPLSWDRRISIASGVAKGLAFLHSSDKHVIYRDFKAANILLDVNYEAKISDFGLAKLGPLGGNSHVTTRIMGTHGYAAPEYVATGHLYVKSDVYGFGVVLLEMLTGLRAVDMNRPKGQQNLVAWAKPCLSNKRKLRTIMDMHLEGQYSLRAAFELAQITVKCLAPEPKLRPSMKEAVEVLEKVEAMNDTRSINNRRSNSVPNYNHRSLHYHRHSVQRKVTG